MLNGKHTQPYLLVFTNSTDVHANTFNLYTDSFKPKMKSSDENHCKSTINVTHIQLVE